jgi:hypothetical protein
MGAGGQTYSASHAFFSLNPDRPFFVLNNSPDRTDQKAFRFLAMPADRKEHLSFDSRANHRGSTKIIRRIPSLVADHLTGLAADTLFFIYGYAVERIHEFTR